MNRNGRGWVVLALWILVMFSVWKINENCPDFPDIYVLDDSALWAVNATPTPEPSASPKWKRTTDASSDAMCRKVASGVSFSRRIIDAWFPEFIQIKRSIQYIR